MSFASIYDHPTTVALDDGESLGLATVAHHRTVLGHRKQCRLGTYADFGVITPVIARDIAANRGRPHRTQRSWYETAMNARLELVDPPLSQKIAPRALVIGGGGTGLVNRHHYRG